MKLKGISTIIIFHKRYKHLENTLQALETGSKRPDEVILIEMDNSKSKLSEYDIIINHVLLDISNQDYLPIAEARNLGAYWSSYNTLAFLDVDCIPSNDYIQNISNTSIEDDIIYMGLPKYLNIKPSIINDEYLDFHSIVHPHRPQQNIIELCHDYGMFWSLTFFLTRKTFLTIDGFDPDYTGYGAEDTDFSFKARELNIKFILTPFKVYHQQHQFYRPPLNNMEAIVKNCNYFYSKWSHWPMSNHLEEFTNRNLIKWHDDQTTPIQIIKLPGDVEIQNALVLDEPYS